VRRKPGLLVKGEVGIVKFASNVEAALGDSGRPDGYAYEKERKYSGGAGETGVLRYELRREEDA